MQVGGSVRYREQAFDVDAVQVGLDLGNATTSCQGFNESHKGGGHNGIPYAD